MIVRLGVKAEGLCELMLTRRNTFAGNANFATLTPRYCSSGYRRVAGTLSSRTRGGRAGRGLRRRGETESILPLEVPAYGVDDDQRVEQDADRTTVRFRLNRFPNRIVTIVVSGKRG